MVHRMVWVAISMCLLLVGCGNIEATIRGLKYDLGDPDNLNAVATCNPSEGANLDRTRTAAEQGDASEQKNLGLLYYKGQCVPKNYVEAAKWFAKSAGQGFAAGQYDLSMLYKNGLGVPKNDVAAYLWCSMAAAQDDLAAKKDMKTIESTLTHDQIAEAQKNAAEWKRAEKGNARAQFHIGMLYTKGILVPQDDVGAVTWYRKGAVQGDGMAQNALGLAYYRGKGVSHDCTEALQWFHKAVDQNQPNAQTNLGWMYYKGLCVTQDFSEALRWTHKAADRGFAEAQTNLGDLYETGEGVPQNNQEAVKWYRLAAEQNNVMGQIRLAHMLSEGKGVKQDDVAAYLWLSLAADHDQNQVSSESVLETAKNALDPLISRMTKEQITQGKKLVAAWKKRHGIRDHGVGSQNNDQEKTLQSGTIRIPLKKIGDMYAVPVTINNTSTIEFLVDSGAADVTVTSDIVLRLVRTGAIQKEDFLGASTYVTADGSQVPTERFTIRSLKIGDTVVLKDVVAGVTPTKGGLLLGQSFLQRFQSWSIENASNTLVLQPMP